MDLAPLEPAVRRLRDAAAASDGARAHLEPHAVPAVRAGASVETVAELTVLTGQARRARPTVASRRPTDRTAGYVDVRRHGDSTRSHMLRDDRKRPAPTARGVESV